MSSSTASEVNLTQRVLYRDGLILIIDKPAGLAVHEGARGEPHLGMFLEELRFGLPRIPELAHRLDRETSGCLVLGRHRKALARLGDLFASGQVEKTYWAVVLGSPSEDSGLIDKPLLKGRGGHHGTPAVIVDPRGQSAQTQWRVLGRKGRLTWIEARPLTGRTHQIRVHLAAMGWPIIGDRLHGRGTADMLAENLHLHARSVVVPLSPGKPPVKAEAAIPAAWGDILATLGRVSAC